MAYTKSKTSYKKAAKIGGITVNYLIAAAVVSIAVNEFYEVGKSYVTGLISAKSTSANSGQTTQNLG